MLQYIFIGVESHRDIVGNSFSRFHQIIKSYDTLSKYRGSSYSECTSETYSLPACDVSDQQNSVLDVTSLQSDVVECKLAEERADETPVSFVMSVESPTNILNTNNAANSDQLSMTSKKVKFNQQTSDAHQIPSTSRATHPSSDVKTRNSSNLSIKHSKQLPFLYNSLPSNSELSVPIKTETESSAVHKHSAHSIKGRQFVRSSSIMVKAGGREVSALDISKAKGHISSGEKELRQASHRSSLNVFRTQETLSTRGLFKRI